MKTIADPCCGSGGFFLAAQDYIAVPNNYMLDREQKDFLKNQTFYGNEIVAKTFKMALMNLYLHNIGDIYGNIPIVLGDSLLTDPGYRVVKCPKMRKVDLTYEEVKLLFDEQRSYWILKK